MEGVECESPAVRARPLKGALSRVDGLSSVEIARMWELFEASYEASEAAFRRDLAAKSHVILVRDTAGAIRGFSTLALWQMEGHPARFLFSGDTVMERAAWGGRALAQTWLESAGAVHGAYPGVPLYWLLTTKGHRTYRYLPQFFVRWFPAAHPGFQDDLDDLATLAGEHFFAGRHDRERHVIVGSTATGRLVPLLAEVPDKDARRSDVRFFLHRNPGYGKGDELLCLARLSPENIRPSFRRAFTRGAALSDEFR